MTSPETPKSLKPSEILKWAASNVVAALTLFGIIFYVISWVPAYFFYEQLGATPDEVGLTYTSILSQSALIVLAIAIIYFYSLSVLIYPASFVAGAVMLIRAGIVLAMKPKLFRAGHNLTDGEYEQKLSALKKSHLPEEWEKTEAAYKERREVRQEFKAKRHLYLYLEKNHPEILKSREGNPSPIVLSALESDDIVSAVYRYRNLSTTIGRARWKAFERARLRVFSWPSLLLASIVALAALTCALTWLARAAADGILSGNSDYIATSGLLMYHARPVSISVASSENPSLAGEIKNETIYLLGQNSQYIVLLLHAKNENLTERVPVGTINVTSNP